jgi:hypothetical protein
VRNRLDARQYYVVVLNALLKLVYCVPVMTLEFRVNEGSRSLCHSFTDVSFIPEELTAFLQK